jgi:hypothetical protein
MKAILTLSISLVISSISFSQTFFSDFEDGTLQGWTNIDATITLLTVEGNSPYLYLQKECDGTNSTIGEMAIINNTEWAGNYFYDVLGEETLINIDEIYMKNDNDFDLHLRYGFTGANGYIVVTTDPIIIPANSDWDIYQQYFSIGEFPNINNLIVLNDTTGLPFEEIYDNVHEMFEEVVEFKIFHNEDISFDGQIVIGTLQIGSIVTYILLSNEDPDIAKSVLYPNPANTIVNLKLPYLIEGSVEIFNVLGENVLSEILSSINTQIDVSELKSGIYLARIQTENQTTIKKLVKL